MRRLFWRGRGEKGTAGWLARKPLSLRERGWGEGELGKAVGEARAGQAKPSGLNA